LGFYSALCVSDKVRVVSKTGEGQFIWESDSAGPFTVWQDTQMVHGEIQQGTKVICYLMPDMFEFLDTQRLRHLVSKYCSSVIFHIMVCPSESDEVRGTKRPAEWSARFDRIDVPIRIDGPTSLGSRSVAPWSV